MLKNFAALFKKADQKKVIQRLAQLTDRQGLSFACKRRIFRLKIAMKKVGYCDKNLACESILDSGEAGKFMLSFRGKRYISTFEMTPRRCQKQKQKTQKNMTKNIHYLTKPRQIFALYL